jgi:hypothetical protein
MSNIRVNQTSPFAPAVCFHRNQFHMVFVANNSSGDLLHAVSPDGINWRRLNNIRQTTKAAPAIASFKGTLRVVFVANNDTNSLLTCTWTDSSDVWSENRQLQESCRAAPMLEQVPDNHLFLYFVANNSTNDLLVTELQ